MINLNDLIAQNTSDTPQKLVDLGLAKQIAGDLTPTHSTPDNIVVQVESETGLKSISFQRLLKLIEIYQLDPLKEDPSRIWFEIDVATEGDFRMSFYFGRAWLDTTELTSNVAVPNVVGKHVVVIEESVLITRLNDNRLQGDLDLSKLVVFSSQRDFILSDNPLLDSVDLRSLTVLHDYMDLNFSNNTRLKSIDLSSLTTVGSPNSITCTDCGLLPSAIENLLHVLANAEFKSAYVNSTLDISGGTNAPYSTWSQQAKDDFTTLQNAGWTITYNQ